MRPYSYVRAQDVDGAVATLAEAPNAAFLAGGTNLVDLMKLGVVQPDVLVDVRRLTPTGSRTSTTAVCARGRVPTATSPPTARYAPATPPLSGPARRRFGPAEKPRNDRRESAAAHALRLLLRHDDAVQQARAWLRLLRDLGPQQEPCDPRRLRTLRRHPPFRYGRGDGGARRVRQRARTGRRTTNSHRGTTPPAWRRARARHDPGARRADHVGRPAATGVLVEL